MVDAKQLFMFVCSPFFLLLFSCFFYKVKAFFRFFFFTQLFILDIYSEFNYSLSINLIYTHTYVLICLKFEIENWKKNCNYTIGTSTFFISFFCDTCIVIVRERMKKRLKGEEGEAEREREKERKKYNEKVNFVWEKKTKKKKPPTSC